MIAYDILGDFCIPWVSLYPQLKKGVYLARIPFSVEEIYLRIAFDCEEKEHCCGLTPNSSMNRNLTQSRGPADVKNNKENRKSRDAGS